jgi:c-di-GMP-binding flagellar brake protein YcgR
MLGPRLTLLDPPDGADENCYVDNASAIRSLLREVAVSGTRAAAYFDTDRRFIHTSLLAVKALPARVIFERGPDAALNAELLQADRITFVTSHDDVPMQFTCRAASATRHDGMDAFRVPVPDRVLRLQRRGYYRLPGEPTHALLKCELVPYGDRTLTLRAAVFDLSCSGIAAAVCASEPLLAQGSTHGFRLELPGAGTVLGSVVVRVIGEIVLPSALPGTRYGLEFADLDEKELALIERYIVDHRARHTR